MYRTTFCSLLCASVGLKVPVAKLKENIGILEILGNLKPIWSQEKSYYLAKSSSLVVSISPILI